MGRMRRMSQMGQMGRLQLAQITRIPLVKFDYVRTSTQSFAPGHHKPR